MIVNLLLLIDIEIVTRFCTDPLIMNPLESSFYKYACSLAYVICGAVARSFGGKQDAKTYRALVSHREIYVQFWPK